MSCSSELIKLEEEVVGISNLQADLKHSWTWRLASEVSGDAGGRTLRETLAEKHQQKLTIPISR